MIVVEIKTNLFWQYLLRCTVFIDMDIKDGHSTDVTILKPCKATYTHSQFISFTLLQILLKEYWSYENTLV